MADNESDGGFRETRTSGASSGLPESAAAPPSISRLGDFEILREIGRGGMGLVYEARQISLGRRVALKVLPPAFGLSKNASQRFNREARAAAKLHHTNIVPVHAIGEQDGYHFYAMDLIEGPSLDRVLSDLRVLEPETESTPSQERSEEARNRSETTLSSFGSNLSETSTGAREWFDHVARLVAEVADSLAYAQSRGVIHRDIKPGNLILSPEGHLCVTDFGLARLTNEPGMTISGSFLGTPAYMSPEQIAAGRIELDHRTDIYSLGVVLYEMLTLRQPFVGGSRDEVLTAIMTRDPASPRKINPKVPVDLETICLKAMEKDPARRYAKADKFASDLRRYLQRDLIAARRASLLRRAARTARRHPVAATSVLAAVVLLGVGGLALKATRAAAQRTLLEQARGTITDAELMMSRGEYRQALDRVDTALEVDPDSIEGRVLRGRLLIELGRQDDAVADARAVLAANPDRWEAHLILAAAAGSVPGLSREEHLAEVEVHAPESADAFYLRSLVADTPAEAVPLLDRALEIDPGHHRALGSRASRNVALKNFQSALVDSDRLIAVRPRSTSGRRLRATIFGAMFDHKQALAELELAIETDPDDPFNYIRRAKILGHDLARWEDALVDVDRAVELEPDNVDFVDSQAVAYGSIGDLEKSLALGRKAQVMARDQGRREYSGYSTEQIVAGALVRLGRIDEARQALEEYEAAAAERSESDRFFYFRNISGWWRNVGDFAESERLAQLAIDVRPNDYRGYVERLHARRMQGQPIEEDCEGAATSEETTPGGLSSRASTMALWCGRPDQAVADLARAIELAPEWAEPYNQRANLHQLAQRWDESYTDFGRAIALAPKYAPAYGGRFGVLVELERFEEAKEDADRFVELRGAGYSSGMSFFWVGYATTLMRLDRIDEAEAIFETVIRENPKASLNHVGLGIVYFLQGRVSEFFRKVDDAAAAEPGSGLLYMLRGNKCAFEANVCEESRADVERALELPPHPMTFEFEVGIRTACRSCPGLYDPARAVEAAKLAVRFAPLRSESHRALGTALLENGDPAAARDAVQRSIDMHYRPGAEDLFLMAMIDWNLGDRASARSYYDRAVARREATFPDNPGALLLQEDARGVLGLSN